MYLGEKVDLLVTYVNYKDSQWIADYEKVAHTRLNAVTEARFRSFGTLRYLFRGIDKFMPYVDEVILIVSKETQVPKWVNKSVVRVITHDKFIPANDIPTFNSCTIESAFHRIPGLDPYIIYTNDDIFPIKESTVEDFFTNGLPNIGFKFYKGYGKNNMFRQQCKNGATLIFNTLKSKHLMDKRKENPPFFKPDHCMTAMTLDTLKTVGYLCGEEMRKCSTPFRSMKNVNQHIYLYYQYFTDKYYDKKMDYKYITFQNGIDSIVDNICNPDVKFLCINDDGLLGKDYDKTKAAIQNALKTRLPNHCRFEI